jgi:hypothetical protein
MKTLIDCFPAGHEKPGMLRLLFLLVLFSVSFETRAAAPNGQEPVSRQSRPPDLKIAVWYERARPLETFRYQVYDVRIRGLDESVTAWLDLVKAKYPAYRAYLRDVWLASNGGNDEKLEIGDAIVREFLVVGTEHGYDFSGFPSPSTTMRRSSTSARPFVPPRSITPRPAIPDGSPGLPFPVPFPRTRP